MKKIFIFLIIMLITFISSISYASYGTDVEYIGNGSEEYVITVPSKMTPNTSGNVIVEGTWPSNRQVNVKADEQVELVNSSNMFNKKKLDINFNEINKSGDNIKSQKVTESILVSNLDSKILFGEWKGNFKYTVEITDKPNDIYYGLTYKNIQTTDGYAPFDLVVYEDKSALRVFEDGSDSFDPGYIKIENNLLYGVSPEALDISKDKTILTLKNQQTGSILMTWELLQNENNILDNAFPINVNWKDISNNSKIGKEDEIYFYKISDLVLTEEELTNLKLTLTLDDIAKNIYSKETRCINDKICIIEGGIISVKEPLILEEVFIEEPGLYITNLNNKFPEISDIKLEITKNTENEKLIWNTLEVKNNKTVNYKGNEFVKISNEVKNEDFFENNLMNLTVDGHIINFRFDSSSHFGNNSIYCYEYNQSAYLYIIAINEPATLGDYTFSEVGVYAFNFGKYNKNYNINIGVEYSPTFKNNVKVNEIYTYKNQSYKFIYNNMIDKYEYIYKKDNSIINRESVNDDGNVLRFNKMLGIVSKDGNSIKLYKYLSEEWEFEEDEVVFVYEKDKQVVDTLYNVIKNQEGTYTQKYTGEHQDSYIKSSTHEIYYYYEEDNNTASTIVNKNNVLFANHCWQMLRTTDTGGVKLLYNGEPDSNGSCGTNRETHEGYLDIRTKTLSSNYYYADDYTYNPSSHSFSLTGNKILSSWSESASKDLIGKYTCKSSNENETCSELLLIDSYKSATEAKALVLNGNSNYSQIGTMRFNKDSDSLAFVGYMYGDVYISNELLKEDIIKYHYGESVTYNNGTYTLSNPKTFTNIPDISELSNNHYICLTQNSNTCTSVGYVHYYRNSTESLYYIILNQGETDPSTAINDMLTKNKTSSTIKRALEYWYERYLLEYNDYIEQDTIYCNDRAIRALNSWNPNGGLLTESMEFEYHSISKNLKCLNNIDKFSVSNITSKLKYPVGLATSPEINLLSYSVSYSEKNFWLQNPSFYGYNAQIFVGGKGSGNSKSADINGEIGVRPVISLTSGVGYISGDGSAINPYKVN